MENSVCSLLEKITRNVNYVQSQWENLIIIQQLAVFSRTLITLQLSSCKFKLSGDIETTLDLCLFNLIKLSMHLIPKVILVCSAQMQVANVHLWVHVVIMDIGDCGDYGILWWLWILVMNCILHYPDKHIYFWLSYQTWLQC